MYAGSACASLPGMGGIMTTDPNPTDDLLGRDAGGDDAAMAELFRHYRKRLRQMVRLRLNRRLQGRVDPSDVVQEAYLDLMPKSFRGTSRSGREVMPPSSG